MGFASVLGLVMGARDSHISCGFLLRAASAIIDYRLGCIGGPSHATADIRMADGRMSVIRSQAECSV